MQCRIPAAARLWDQPSGGMALLAFVTAEMHIQATGQEIHEKLWIQQDTQNGFRSLILALQISKLLAHILFRI